MHPQNILFRALVVNDLRSLNDTIRAQVARALSRQQRAFVLPLDEVGRRVAVDVLERRSTGLVLSNPK